MKYLTFFTLLIFIMLPSFSYSKPSPPVKHSHNGRVHTHPLPNNGKGTHQHGKTQKRKISVPHFHNGRKHSHLLPESGVNHNHSGQSSAPNKPGTSNETTATKETETGTDNKISTSDRKNTDTEVSADIKTDSTLTQEQAHFNDFMKNTGLLDIVNRRGLNKLSADSESTAYPYYFYWYPKKGSHGVSGINGPGELRFKVYPDGWENGSSAIKIESNFNNGKPVGNGKLSVSELSKSYASARKEINISPASNIRNLIMENFNITENTESD